MGSMTTARVGSKQCFKCGVTKSRVNFYKHRRMSDGLLGKCKVCTKKDASEYRHKHLEKIRAYDRKRAKNQARQAAAAFVVKAWRAADRRRGAAHSAVQSALKNGRLVKQPCPCGSEKSLAHHEDYDRKLEVVWLCQPCHKRRHKEMKSWASKMEAHDQ